MKKSSIAILFLFFAGTTTFAQQTLESFEQKHRTLESDEPFIAVSVEPFNMLVYQFFYDIPSVFLVVENVINSNASIMTQPFYMGKDFSKKSENLDIDIFGISEGFRYYFGRYHRGWFTTAQFSYQYANLDYTYDDDPDDNFNVTGNAIGIGMYLGTKSVWGFFTTSWSIGFTYTQIFIKGDSKNDSEEVLSNGIGIDANYTVGFTL
ncbi:MAG: DUF3575 domain-containing protein [Fibrobacter sp.]|nr:DUF3575 domain-containing protein [Fibrobacter sp.]